MAHEAIQYSSTSLEGKGKSPRLWAVGLDGLCNAARGLGGATSQQQTLPHTDQSGLTQENGWIWSRSWPTSFHCVEPFPCRKKKSACTSFKSKVPTTEKIHRITFLTPDEQIRGKLVFNLENACNPYTNCATAVLCFPTMTLQIS